MCTPTHTSIGQGGLTGVRGMRWSRAKAWCVNHATKSSGRLALSLSSSAIHVTITTGEYNTKRRCGPPRCPRRRQQLHLAPPRPRRPAGGGRVVQRAARRRRWRTLWRRCEETEEERREGLSMPLASMGLMNERQNGERDLSMPCMNDETHDLCLSPQP